MTSQAVVSTADVTIGSVTYRLTRDIDQVYGKAEILRCYFSPSDLSFIPEVVSYGGKDFEVNAIGSAVFQNNSSLKGVLSIPKFITKIGAFAFNNCSGIETVKFNNIAEIGASCFSHCISLREVNFHSLSTSIGNSAFEHCPNLTEINSFGSISKIGDRAFYDTSLEGELRFGNKLYSVGAHAFEGIETLTGSLEIPSSVNKIGMGAFSGCKGLNGNLVINASEVGVSAFYGTGFTGTLTLGDNVTTIGESAFEGVGFTGALTLPKNLTVIEPKVFKDCEGFSGNVTLSNALTSIGDFAFYNTHFKGDLTIPESVVTIGRYAFANCTDFDGNLDLGKGALETIGQSAFAGMSNIKGNIHLPDGLKSLGYAAFQNCESLDGDLSLGASLDIIPGYAFANCVRLKGGLVLPPAIEAIGGYAFYNCGELTGSLIIPNSVSEIVHCAFKNCKKLGPNLKCSNRLTEIDQDVFYGCENIATVDLGREVTNINATAFSGTHLRLVEYIGSVLPSFSGESDFEEFSSAELYINSDNIDIAKDENGWSAFSKIWPIYFKEMDDDTTTTLKVNLGEKLMINFVVDINDLDYEFPKLTKDGSEVRIINDRIVIPAESGQAHVRTNGSKGEFFLNISKPSDYTMVSSIAFNTGEIWLNVGDTYKLEYTILPENATVKTVSWTYNESIVTVDENSGLVKAISEGETGIAITPIDFPTYHNHRGATCMVHVTKSGFKWNQEFRCNVGDKIKLEAISDGGTLAYRLICPNEGYITDLPIYEENGEWYAEFPEEGTCIIEAYLNGRESVSLRKQFNVIKNGSELIYADGIYYRYTDSSQSALMVVRGYERYDSFYSIPAEVNGLPVVRIDKNAFANTPLQVIHIPASIQDLGNSAFYNTTDLRHIYLYNPVPIRAYEEIFNYDVSYQKITLHVPERTTPTYKINYIWKSFPTIVADVPNYEEIEGDLWYSYDFNHKIATVLGLYNGNNVVENLVIPDKVIYNGQSFLVTQIAASAFNGSKRLKGTLTIGKYVLEIGPSAFSGVSGFEGSLIIPNGVRTIGEFAFWNTSFDGELILGEDLKYIGNSSFGKCAKFRGDLIIPDRVKTIEYSAFELTSFDGELKIGASVTSIGNYAFRYCENFHGDLEIPDQVETVGWQAFYRTSFDGELKIGSSLKELSYGTFSNCNNLHGNLVVPANIKIIQDEAFLNCSGFDGSLILSEGLEKIRYDAFSGTNFKEIRSLAVDPPTTGGWQFGKFYGSFDANLYDNASLYVPEISMDIYQAASEWKEFKTILPNDNPETVLATAITLNASDIQLTEGDQFQLAATILPENTSNKNVTWRSNNPDIVIVDNAGLVKAVAPGETYIVAATTDGSNLEAACRVTVKDKDDVVGDIIWEQQLHCNVGDRIKLEASCADSEVAYRFVRPNGGYVTNLPIYEENGEWYAEFPEEGAAIIEAYLKGNEQCNVRRYFNVVANGDELIYIDGIYYRYTDYSKSALKVVRGYEMYVGSYEISATVNGLPVFEIGRSAFYSCRELDEVKINEGITSIRGDAFGNSTLSALHVPASVQTIESFSLTANGGRLLNIYLYSTNPIAVTDKIFNGDVDYTKCILHVPNGTVEAYRNAEVWKEFVNIVDDIPDAQSEEILRYSYNDDDHTATVLGLIDPQMEVENLVIPDTTDKDGQVYKVTKIDTSAFRWNHGLTGTLTLGQNLIRIEDFAFDGNEGFTGSLIIPNSVTYIGDYAFANSSFDGKLSIGNSVEYLGKCAFWGCSNLQGEIKIPESVKVLRQYAFSECSGFTGSLTLHNSITEIHDNVFNGCTNLNGGLTIGEQVTQIGPAAFHYTNFSEIKSLALVPPTLGGVDDYGEFRTTFDSNLYNKAKLYVPTSVIPDYSNADEWKNFIISSIEDSGFIDILQDNNPWVKIYNLAGTLLYEGNYNDAHLQKGVYIVISQNRRYKILI